MPGISVGHHKFITMGPNDRRKCHEQNGGIVEHTQPYVKERTLEHMILRRVCTHYCNISSDYNDRCRYMKANDNDCFYYFVLCIVVFAEQMERDSIRITKELLQCLWNVCCHSKEKELSIGCKVVPAAASLLSSSSDEEIKRLAAGLIMVITAAERGKVAVIELPECIRILCVSNCRKFCWFVAQSLLSCFV